MNSATARALEAIGNINAHLAFRSLMPTAPMTAGEIIALHAFSQMWSAMWGVSRPLYHEDNINSQTYTDDDLMTREDEDVR